jgi:hypothetical protein
MKSKGNPCSGTRNFHRTRNRKVQTKALKFNVAVRKALKFNMAVRKALTFLISLSLSSENQF